MKKLIFAMCLIIAFTLLNAQLINSYGFKVGVCIANQDFDYVNNVYEFDMKSRIGLDLGFFIELLNNEILHLLIETHYMQKGHIFEFTVINEEIFGPDAFSNEEFQSRVDYMTFDILCKFFINHENVTSYFFAGPRLDILLDYDSEEHLFDAIYDELEPIDFGIDVGFGFEFQILKEKITLIEFRYTPTLTTSFEGEYYTIKNTSFEILTGVKF